MLSVGVNGRVFALLCSHENKGCVDQQNVIKNNEALPK